MFAVAGKKLSSGQNKTPTAFAIGVSEFNLDDDLLSHGETPHYHRRCIVSLLSSGWGQVVPMLYGRQANWPDCPRSYLRFAVPGGNQIRWQIKLSVLWFVCSSTCCLHWTRHTIRCLLFCLSHPHQQPRSRARCLMQAIANNLDYMVKPHGQLVLVS